MITGACVKTCLFASAISIIKARDHHAMHRSRAAYARKDWLMVVISPKAAADVQRFRASKVGRLAARTGPQGSLEALERLADRQMWLFIFDDRFSDESVTGADLERLTSVLSSFIIVLDSGGAQWCRADPFTTALGDIMDRFSRLATQSQVFRFVNAVRGYLLAQFWEAGHRAAGRPAGLAEYELMRRHSGAVPTCVALIDVADGFELATEVARYLEAEAPLRCGATPELRRYLDGLRSWMSGNFHWSLESGRYGLAALST